VRRGWLSPSLRTGKGVGEQRIGEVSSDAEQRAFTRSILDDLEALERMLEGDLFETGIRRVGAEQEMFLVDDSLRPAPVATEVIEALNHPSFTTELALFNLEANCEPRVFGGGCLRHMEEELVQLVAAARAAAASVGADVLLTGILPTLRKDDLHLGNMTPAPRYAALNRAMVELRGGAFRIALEGLDELDITHDNVMLEACNTSFQVHFQAGPEEFARLYNIAQAVTAPVLAAGVNSPTLLGHRLWRETRVGLFQQSVDERSSAKQARGHRPRVSFGERWLQNSIIEIFREDIARFRIVLSTDAEERPLELVERGIAPQLKALRLHNGTVYRWNRPCYGIIDGKAHLRVENRVLPSGPTILDEMANAAFFFGLMASFVEEHRDISKAMLFDDARANFFSAARYGLTAQFNWIGGRRVPASELILKELLPLARTGLEMTGIEKDDITRYLDVIQGRVESERTGAQWALSSLAGMPEATKRESKLRTLTAAIRKNQWFGSPVHEWPDAGASEKEDWRADYKTVGQFMTTQVFTVRAEDLVDLAASVMDWERVRHIPVEDNKGALVGLISHRDLLRLVSRGLASKRQEPMTVGDIMVTGLITATPDTPTLEAIRLLREHQVSCLPVVKDDRLVGIITASDFLDVAEHLMTVELREVLA
jgi:CBS domain-containing protein